jgi:hypothetical protein
MFIADGRHLDVDFGRNTLGCVELAARIEAKLGVKVGESELGAVTTVKDPAQLVLVGGRCVKSRLWRNRRD